MAPQDNYNMSMTPDDHSRYNNDEKVKNCDNYQHVTSGPKGSTPIGKIALIDLCLAGLLQTINLKHTHTHKREKNIK